MYVYVAMVLRGFVPCSEVAASCIVRISFNRSNKYFANEKVFLTETLMNGAVVTPNYAHAWPLLTEYSFQNL